MTLGGRPPRTASAGPADGSPARGGRDSGERTQVGPSVLAEQPGLLVKLADRVGERLPLTAQVRLRAGGSVMLAADPRVELVVGQFGGRDELFGLTNPRQDILDVRLQGLFQRPELLFQGLLQPLPLGECLLGPGAGDLAPFDRLGLRGEIFFRLGQLGPLGVQLGGGVLELRGRPRDRIHLVVGGRHPAFGGGLPQAPGHGVDLCDRGVQGRPCRRGLVPRAGEQHGVGADGLGRLRDRGGIRQLAPGPPEVL